MTIQHQIRRLDTRAHLASLFSSAVLLAACSSRVPARVETVEGHQVEIATAGTGGGATVVFEAGLEGEPRPSFTAVEPPAADHGS
jgi:hypothetical protein